MNHSDELNKIKEEIYNRCLNLKSNVNLSQYVSLIYNDIKYAHLRPISVTQSTDNYIDLSFEILGKSTIFGSSNKETNSNTRFNLREFIGINKSDHAYVILYFPNYDANMNIKHDYLLSTLLVGYMLKNMQHNYDLMRSQAISGTKARVICMITPDIDHNIKNLLLDYYDETVVVPYISFINAHVPDTIKTNNDLFITIEDVSKNMLRSSHSYSKVFTKLNIFNSELFPFKKVILIDSDLFPLAYFDTLFSLDTPAGWLEHRRLLNPIFGAKSWIYDREQFCKHGLLIPKILTDIENEYASDINASLLVIEPDIRVFHSMISELQSPLDTWFGKDKIHKGFWLGDKFHDYYLLPEQNYLTRKFSGQWKSIDFGFCSWSIELENSFGFTFAGFVTKPWKTQSVSHKYTINTRSIFSQINNSTSDRSGACELMTTILAKMIYNKYITKSSSNRTICIPQIIYDHIMSIQVLTKPFDPWEPEIDLSDSNISNELMSFNQSNMFTLGYDQQKLLCLTHDIYDSLYINYIFSNITRHIFNIDFIVLTNKLINILYTIIPKTNVKFIFPFGNTLTSLLLFGMNDITDDDSDFVIIVRDKYDLFSVIRELLQYNIIQVYLNLKDNIFVKINEYNELDKYDLTDIQFFNFSFRSDCVCDFMRNNCINISKNILMKYDNKFDIKLPWVDIFFLLDDPNSDKFSFTTQRTLYISKYIYLKSNNVIADEITGIKHRIPLICEYYNEYYKSHDKLRYYFIKNVHNTNNRDVIFKVDLQCDLNKCIIGGIYSYYKYHIKQKYNKNIICIDEFNK